jgi:glutamate synthase (NADPH/NADH) small chain
MVGRRQAMPIKYEEVSMREQLPEVRKNNFEEVPLGYSKEEAQEEASRCLQCKTAPCVGGCPVEIDIPGFIAEITKGDFDESISIINKTNSLPCMTGRVCPQETQCQERCVVGKKGAPVSIGHLERFVADIALEKRKNAQNKSGQKLPEPKKEKVAIIGSGPAGLTCAADLAKEGYKVTIFEGFHKLGGVLVYGIPEFRLPKEIVETEINALKELSVEFVTDALIGRIMTINELMGPGGYSAAFIGTGAGLPKFMDLPGENLNGVYSANEFLTRVNLMKAYKFPEYETPVHVGKNVAVIGGGNVAMDAARTAIRLGADNVYLIYRRSEEEMPARNEEIHHAKDEGLIFKTLHNPVKYIGNEQGFVEKMECVKMELGEPDESGRRRPAVVEGSNYEIDIDVAIIAVGTTPNPLIAKTTPDLKIGKWGEIPTDENMMTNIPGVFAGGDIVTGAATVITAMAAGKKAAASIDLYFEEQQTKDK